MPPTRVIFVVPNALPIIEPGRRGVFGGLETRACTFAKGLSRRDDFEVALVVRHWETLSRNARDGIQLHLQRDRLYPWRESLASRLKRVPRFPWLRLETPRVSDAITLPLCGIQRLVFPRRDPRQPNAFFQRLPGDLFLTFGVQAVSASVIASAQASQRPAVLFLGSDGDLDERYATSHDYVSPYGDRADVCRWLLENADQIFCQTPAQLRLLQSRFGRTGVVIQNPIDLTEWDRGRQMRIESSLTAGLKRYVLWVGRAEAEHKRPQLLLDVANNCPDVDFLMVLNSRDAALAESLRGRSPNNVHFVESVPFAAMPAVFHKAACLVNTSSLEGFPNTFLQAAATGVPIASLRVEADFLSAARAGACANDDLPRLAEMVHSFWNGNLLGADVVVSRRYIEKHHGLSSQVDVLADALRQVAG